jgi:hypothetical protein
LTYWPEDDCHGELIAEARHAAFAGRASGWLNADILRQFALPLRDWPPALGQPVTIQGGYYSASTTGSAPVETHVAITIAQRGSLGRYWLEAALTEPDYEVLPQSATVRFAVEPAALLSFAGEVTAMLDAGGSAILPTSGGDLPDPEL